MFEQIPREILYCILDQLRGVHTTGSTLRIRCLQDDLRALCLSHKRWHRVAREHLYREIWAPPNEDTRQKTALPIRRPMTRLQLLLRTFQDSPALADMTRHLRITADLASQLESEIKSDRHGHHKSTTVNLLSEIVTKCQNLEQFSGFAPAALEPAAELLAALSGCPRLKSHVWRLPSEETDQQFGLKAADFLSCYTKWPRLQTLVLWQSPNGCSIPPGTVSAVVQRLPSLRHLFVRGLHPVDFHNGTLLMLPALKSLRLEEVHGITDQGLEQLTHSRLAFSLERLTLSGLELTSLRTIQTLFANLSRLRRFTLLQDTSPALQQWSAVASSNFSLQSTSLAYIHWDVIAQGHATAILANSIAAGKFPRMQKVKVPCDYDGAVQNLCRPIPYRSLADTDIRILVEWDTRSHYHRSLQVSQIQAQLRVHESRKQPAFNVVVQDEDANIQHTHAIGAYLGNIASEIEYSLDPAIEGTEVAIAPIDIVAMPRIAGSYQDRRRTEEQLLDLDVLF